MSEVHSRPLLDRLRWVSAWTVAFGHAVALVIAAPRQAGSPEWIALYFAELRHPAVLIFFVLSGYLVGGSTLLNRNRFSWRRYTIARFSRIYIVLIPALLLILSLDGLSYAIDPSNPVCSLVWPRGAIGSVALYDRYSTTNVIWTLFLVQEIFGTSVGSGGQLWSLSYEWIFYFLFPAIVLMARRLSGSWLILVGVLSFAGLTIIFKRAPLGWLFILWCLGAGSRHLQSSLAMPKAVAWLGAATCAAAFFLTPLLPFRLAEFHVAAGLAVYLSRFDPGKGNTISRWERSFADFSYSLYLIHLPVIVFLAFIANRLGLLPPQGIAVSFLSIGMIFGGLAPAFALAYIFGRLFEARTDPLRRWLGALGRPPVTSTDPHSKDSFTATL